MSEGILIGEAGPETTNVVSTDALSVAINRTKGFLAFLQDKTATLRMKGGNTDELYAVLLPNAQSDSDTVGRWKMAESLRRQHPDVVKVGRRFKRHQHVVDYSGFKNISLIPNGSAALREFS